MMRTQLAAIVAAGLAAAVPLRAQPATDIYLAALENKGGVLHIGNPRNITDRAGYDNQPAFTRDGTALLFTSIREDGQADTYRYDLASGSIARVTATAVSEYSPTPVPGGDGFSVVRVEADSTQRLWRFDMQGGSPQLILSDVKPVGYHAWIDSGTVALFVLGEPPILQIADVASGSTRTMAKNIGRSLHRMPLSGELSFVHKRAEDAWWIEALDPVSGEMRGLTETLAESEDYAWTPDGAILMAQGSSLYSWDSRSGGDWALVDDLADAGITRITRLAVAPSGRLVALVSIRPTEEANP